ncbi:MAG: M15 family metallopeptidase [Oscillospiraceae bacterium]|nr:M15 family metallopeptidase [Oscillospiraceae bacterium]
MKRSTKKSVLISLSCIVVILAVVLLFIFLQPTIQPVLTSENELDVYQEDSVDMKPIIMPETEPNRQPDEEPETTETLEEPTQPETTRIYEVDGVTYISLEGVEVLLVNKVYALPPNFGGPNEEATAALNRMFAVAAEDGISLYIVSGYRSYDTQASIYNRYVADWGQEYTDTVSARPGHSEHQTGLTFDINSLSNSFKNTDEYAWLQQHAAEYGFIMRYLEGSEWATGYSFEPWHYRYIADSQLATNIMESKLSLEEYAGLVTERPEPEIDE